MLTVLQVLTLASAFFLPWTIGGIVTFTKQGKTKARNLSAAGLALCVLIIAVTIAVTTTLQ